jgi:DNA-binding transcriptional ArsR family regulator
VRSKEQPIVKDWKKMQFSNLLSSSSRVARVLKAMSNDRRLRILCHLSEKERSVGELCALVGMGQSALSQHLAKLRADKIVKTRREAQTIYYSIASKEITDILTGLQEVLASSGAEGKPLESLSAENPLN